MEQRTQVRFYLNGKQQSVGGQSARRMLAEYLREERGLVGTKIVCAEGDCGACTVLRLDSVDSTDGSTPSQFKPINSCITTVAQVDGTSLITVDALHDENGLTPVQKAMIRCHGSQCGFCTPGFVMALSGLVEKKQCQGEGTTAQLSAQETKNALTGNLCRCTGYQPIIDAAVSIPVSKSARLFDRFSSVGQIEDLKSIRKTPLLLKSDDFSYFAPTTPHEASTYLNRYPTAKIIAGGSDLGVLHNKYKQRFTHLISLHAISEVHELRELNDGATRRISVGAGVTLSVLRQYTKTRVPEFSRFLDLFASPQIKNSATLVGNVGNASPIADTPPFLLVAGGTLRIVNDSGERSLPITDYYLGYRKTALLPGEWIRSIEFEIPAPDETLALYKVSQRKDLDISAVNAAFRVKWAAPDRRQIESFQCAMGGIAATPIRLRQTEALLNSALQVPSSIDRAIAAMQAEIQPLSDLRASSDFRRLLSENLLKRFFREHS